MGKIDVLVIGAGVVGLAIARAFSFNNREVIVAEREKIPGSMTSARNSGVLHAGIYYPQGSNKARLCVEGKKRLHEYVKERNVPYKNCTKLIVACTEDEIPKLEAIKQKAVLNGVTDLRIIKKQEAIALEPALTCHAALHSPSTGIVDVHHLMQEFIVDIESQNGLIAYDNQIEKIEVATGTIYVTLSDGNKTQVNTLINAAGLNAQNIANKIEGFDKNLIPKQYLAKGNYFGVTGAIPFSRLIYPVPVQGGLGVHFTMNLGGESLFGPDVEWLDDNGSLDYKVNSERSKNFYDSIARFWPDIKTRDLFPAYAGIRPKISGPNMPDGDFIIQDKKQHGIKGLVNLYGIESPGLTASMAIANEIVKIF